MTVTNWFDYKAHVKVTQPTLEPLGQALHVDCIAAAMQPIFDVAFVI